jgi:hypothetical protein
MGCKTGSPTPEGGASHGTTWTSTCGIAEYRKYNRPLPTLSRGSRGRGWGNGRRLKDRSAVGGNRGPGDAAIHRDLKHTADQARALLEEALIRVVRAEAMSLPANATMRL